MIWKLCVPIGCFLVAGVVVRADDPAKPPTKTDQTQTEASVGTPESGKPEPGPLVRSIDADLLKALEKHTAPEAPAEESPLLRVGRRMRDVQGRLLKADAGEETRGIQKEIVHDLEELIEELKKGGG